MNDAAVRWVGAAGSGTDHPAYVLSPLLVDAELMPASLVARVIYTLTAQYPVGTMDVEAVACG